jgi:hypothetical protein
MRSIVDGKENQVPSTIEDKSVLEYIIDTLTKYIAK